MENLGAMAYSRYTGFREITDRDVLELHCTHNMFFCGEKKKKLPDNPFYLELYFGFD